MEKIRLGRTDLMVSRTAFGALPIQRISQAEACALVRRDMRPGSTILIPPTPIQTARRSWARPCMTCAKMW